MLANEIKQYGNCWECDDMREVIVSYLLMDEDEQRLKRITEEYKKQGLNLSEDKMFEGIMCCGSKYDVDSKLKFHDGNLG